MDKFEGFGPKVQRWFKGLEATSPLQFMTKTWRAAAPVTRWLDDQVGPSTMPPERERRGR